MIYSNATAELWEKLASGATLSGAKDMATVYILARAHWDQPRVTSTVLPMSDTEQMLCWLETNSYVIVDQPNKCAQSRKPLVSYLLRAVETPTRWPASHAAQK